MTSTLRVYTATLKKFVRILSFHGISTRALKNRSESVSLEQLLRSDELEVPEELAVAGAAK